MKNKNLYLIFDISGSTTPEIKKYYNDVYEYYTKDLSLSEFKIIGHTTEAKFYNMNSILKEHLGGTYISAGLKLAVADIIANKSKQNTVIICGDGDNWSEDNVRVFNLIEYLIKNNVKVIIHEFFKSTFDLKNLFRKITDKFENCVDFYTVANTNQDIFGNYTKTKIKVYQVEHLVGGKLYDFLSNESNLRVGDMVVCNTIKGKTYGRIIRIISRLEEEKEIKKYKKIKKI